MFVHDSPYPTLYTLCSQADIYIHVPGTLLFSESAGGFFIHLVFCFLMLPAFLFFLVFYIPIFLFSESDGGFLYILCLVFFLILPAFLFSYLFILLLQVWRRRDLPRKGGRSRLPRSRRNSAANLACAFSLLAGRCKRSFSAVNLRYVLSPTRQVLCTWC